MAEIQTNSGFKNRLKQRLLSPIWNFLKQGITPIKLSKTIALGVVIGAFPMIGTTTALCTLASFIFKLNFAVLQFVNYLSYPIQIICIIPFYQLGAFIFQEEPFILNFYDLKNRVTTDFIGTALDLWQATFHAIVAWSIVAPLAYILISFLTLPLLKKVKV